MLLAIWLLAVLLRGLYLWEIADTPFFTLRLGDAAAYDAWARRIADGDWLGEGVFYQAPFYPYFLAAVYRLFGDDAFTVRLVQAVLGASSCALLASAGVSLFGRPGFVAGLLLAVYPAAIYFDALLEKTSLVIFFTTGLLAALAVQPDRLSAARCCAAGGLLALLVLVRENALLLAPLVLLWIALGTFLRTQWPRAPAAFMAGAMVVVLPVGVRNLVVGGEFHLTTSQLGPNLYIGNHPGATGTYEPLVAGHGSAADEREDATRLAEQAAGRSLRPAEVSRFWTARAVEYIRAEPVEWLRLMVRKLALALNHAELADTEARDVYADWSTLLRGLRPFGFSAVLAIGMFGAALTARSWRRLWLVYAIGLTYVASVTMFYVLERYRIPIVPVLMLLGAGGLGELTNVTKRDRQRVGVAAAAAVAGMVLAHLPLVNEHGARATHYTGIAAVLANDPLRLDDAIAFYTRAIEEAPESPVARFGLGTVLMRSGHVDAALPHLRAAVNLRPDYADARYNLGLALAAAGDVQAAADQYQAGLRLRPDDADTQLALAKAYLTLNQPQSAVLLYEQTLARHPQMVAALVGRGVALTELGRLDEALAAYKRALEIAPNDPAVYNNLGIALARAGQIGEAIVQFERALALDPKDENARRNLARALQEAEIKP